jgi:hypothetical protein
LSTDDQYGVLNRGSENAQSTRRVISRRELLKRTGMGMAAGLASGALGRRLAGASGKIPFSLIIDDGSPVDPLFYEIPGYETPFLVPRAFTERVAVQKVFGNSVEWVTMTEMAALATQSGRKL